MNMWMEYVEAVTDGATQTAIALHTGITQSTISRWLRGDKVPTEAAQAAKFAQKYQRNPLEAFVAAGMLTIEEAGRGLDIRERTFLVELMDQSEGAGTLRHVANRGDIEEPGEF